MDFQVLQCFGIGTCEFIESLRPPCQNSTSHCFRDTPGFDSTLKSNTTSESKKWTCAPLCQVFSHPKQSLLHWQQALTCRYTHMYIYIYINMILYDLCHAHRISSIRIITSHAVRPFRADSGIASAASTWSTLIGSLLPTWACQVSVVAATASASFLRTPEVNDVNIFKQESIMKKSSLSPLYIGLFYEFSQTSILEDFRKIARILP